MTDQNNQSKVTYSSTEFRAIIKSITQLPNSETKVAEISLLSGANRDGEQKFLNGSFVVGKHLAKFADAVQDVALDARCTVEIGNIYCEAAAGDEGRLFENYRGFLNKITFG